VQLVLRVCESQTTRRRRKRKRRTVWEKAEVVDQSPELSRMRWRQAGPGESDWGRRRRHQRLRAEMGRGAAAQHAHEQLQTVSQEKGGLSDATEQLRCEQLDYPVWRRQFTAYSTDN